MVATKNGQVEEISDLDSEGVGVRVLVDGAWGFACDRRTDGGGRPRGRAARDRVREGRAGRPPPLARAGRGATRRSTARRSSAIPFSVSIADKVALCLKAEEEMKHDDVTVRSAFVRAHREHKLFVSSLGSAIEQELVETGGGIEAIATGDGLFQVRSYPSAHGGSSSQAGWEYVEGLDLVREAPRVGEQASALLRADECPGGNDDRRPRLRPDDAPDPRVDRPPDRARPRLRDRGGLRGHELPQARATSARCATARS